MRNTLFLAGMLALVASLGFGCAGPTRKMGRGLTNMMEPLRGAEFERGIEQGGMFDGTDAGVTTGFISGVNHTFARSGLGLFEVVTAPLPFPDKNYDPLWTSYVTPKPYYPDGYSPTKWDDATFDTDHFFGFSGGDIAPYFFGSRFRVFDN